MSKIHDVANYQFSKGEKILIDTNIWLYLYPAPQGKAPKCAKIYSAAIKKLEVAKAQAFTDTLIISEYINRYLRTEWSSRQAQHRKAYKEYEEEYKEKSKENYKDFRKTEDFAIIYRHVTNYIRNILSYCEMHDVAANQYDLNQAMHDSKQSLDFNDAILTDICRKKDFKLMTNDADFQHSQIEILTALKVPK